MPNVKRKKTNVEAVVDLMEFSQYGPLAQAFVLDALLKHCDKVIVQAKPEQFTNGIVSYEAWTGVAKEIKEKVLAHLGS